MLIKYLLFINSAFSLTYNTYIDNKIINKDPYNLIYIEEYEVYRSILDTLFIYKAEDKLIPSVAESWYFDENKRTINFKIRSNLKFSDNTDITIKDIYNSITRVLRLDTGNYFQTSKCLKKLNKINIKYKDNLLILGPTNCKESIMKEIGEPEFGIISSSDLRPNNEVDKITKFSGAYEAVFNHNNQLLKLKSNIHNWRNVERKNIEIAIKDKLENVDFYKSNLEPLESDIYKFKLNTPLIVTWYFIYDEKDYVHAKSIKSLIKEKKDEVGNISSSFFPKGSICYNHQDLSRQIGKVSSKFKVNYINEYGDLGAKVINAFNDAISENLSIKGKNIQLVLRRQFIADGEKDTISFLFRDPKIINIHKSIISQYINEDTNLSSICNRFNESTNIIPFLNSRIYFNSKTKIDRVFDDVTGTLNYNQLIGNE